MKGIDPASDSTISHFDINKFPKRPTKLANINPVNARIIIGLTLLLIVNGIMSLENNSNNNQKIKSHIISPDRESFKHTIKKINHGLSYYEATHLVLTTNNYPTASVFNWRLPLWAMSAAWLQNYFNYTIAAIALLSTLLWLKIFQTEFNFLFSGLAGILICSYVYVGLFREDFFYIHANIAGLLISLSLSIRLIGKPLLSIIPGILALFIRELTLAWVFIMIGIAFIKGYKLELSLWITGVVIFLIYFGFHYNFVSGYIDERSISHSRGWLEFGGWKFVLKTSEYHPYIKELPGWLIAILFPLSLLGLLSWPGDAGLYLSLSVAIYVLSYLAVGLPVNNYWGGMYTELWPLGLIMAYPALRDLIKRAAHPKKRTDIRG